MPFTVTTALIMLGVILALAVRYAVSPLPFHFSLSIVMSKPHRSRLASWHKAIGFNCFRSGLRVDSLPTPTLPTLHTIQSLLNPDQTSPTHLLRQRAIPNEKLGRIFELCNAFVSEDTEVHDRFVRDVKNRMKGHSLYSSMDDLGPAVVGQEWIKMKGLIQTAVGKYAPAPSHTSSTTSFTTFVQSVTFAVMCSFLFNIEIEKMNPGDVAIVTTGINSVWLDVKRGNNCIHGHDHSDSNNMNDSFGESRPGASNHLVSEIKERMRLWFGDGYEQASQAHNSEGNPLNILIPAYETMWRAVAVALAYTATVSFGSAASEPSYNPEFDNSSQPGPHPSPGHGPCPCHPFPYPGPGPNPFPHPCPFRNSNSSSHSSSLSYGDIFVSFLDNPTSSQYEAEYDGISVKSVICEVLRLHSPVKRIARAVPVQSSFSLSWPLDWGPWALIPWAVRSLRVILLYLRSKQASGSQVYRNGTWYKTCKADIQALHLDTAIWGPNAGSFDPRRFSTLGLPSSPTPMSQSAALTAYLPFGYGPLKCKAAHWAPRVIGLIVGGILEVLQDNNNQEENTISGNGRKSGITKDETILKITNGPKIGGREGWEGWSVARI